MGSVGSSSTLGGSVDLDVVDSQVFNIFGVGISLHIIEEAQYYSDGFFWPSTHGYSEFGGLSGSTHSSEVLQVGNTSLVVEDIIHVLFGLDEGHSSHCVGSFVGILIVDSEVFS